MRLSSTSFTHASTALFGLAIAGYVAVRLAGYDAPQLPGHLSTPAPPILQRVPDSLEHPPNRSATRTGEAADHTTGPVGTGDHLKTRVPTDRENPIARSANTTVASVAWSRAAQDERRSKRREEEADPQHPSHGSDDASDDASDDGSDDAADDDTASDDATVDVTSGDASQ